MKNDDNSKELKHKCDDSKFPADVSDKKKLQCNNIRYLDIYVDQFKNIFSEEK